MSESTNHPSASIKTPMELQRLLQQAVALHQQGRLAEADGLYGDVLRHVPNQFDALHLRGTLKIQQGAHDLGIDLVERALKIKPDSPKVLTNLGLVLLGIARYQQAVSAFDRALAVMPDNFPAHHGRAMALMESGRPRDAILAFDRALALSPNDPDAHNHRGLALAKDGRHDLAIRSYSRALELRPDFPAALMNRGISASMRENHAEALADFDRVLLSKPNDVDALINRGHALRNLQKIEEAIATYDKALAIDPRRAEAICSRGMTRAIQHRHADALADYERALEIDPTLIEALCSRGYVLLELKRFSDALRDCERALAIQSDHAETLNCRGAILIELGRPDEALTDLRGAIAAKPTYAEAYCNLGGLMATLNRFDEAIAAYRKALEIQPDHPYAFGRLLGCHVLTCDWKPIASMRPALATHIGAKTSVFDPFLLLAIDSSPAEQLACAENYAQFTALTALIPVPRSTKRSDKIRIAYVSGDFQRHPTTYLLTELLEKHDRSRFETVAVSFGSDDQSVARRRLAESVDRFLDVSTKSDQDIARTMGEWPIDIAIDLMGYVHKARPGIFAHRPAPVQVNYLGYPGTVGAKFLDYILADRVVLPMEDQPFYSEKIVHLPDCYQVNDTKKAASPQRPTRAECGLPETGFVFCCFNANYKIGSEVFDVWMRLLKSVEGSVLWLFRSQAKAVDNLRREAKDRGIDPARLIFAEPLDLPDHLARLALADIVIDTLPYNAHTTASDALWMGVPIVTCQGETFPARVAASLLQTIGLPELVTHNLADYEALAARLAGDPAHLASIRQKLVRNRPACALYDTDRYRRHIEAAYATMWDIWQRGENPRGFSVDPIEA